ncbi:MAG TPA: AEC family transporter [Methanophagales archaeon]|nr:AEC family transporter [Methanophagales archaeon]
MQELIQTVIPIFTIILVGYAIGKIKKVDIQSFIDLIVYIAGPCLIFSSIVGSDINLTEFTTIAVAALAIIFSMALLALLVLKIAKSDKKGLCLPMTFGNTSYLGYPVALFAFGMDGLSRAVVYDMMNSLVIFSLGIYIIQHRNELQEAFKVPLLYAVVVGLIVNLLKIPVPQGIFKPIEMIGMITIPLALLVLGYKLTQINIEAAKIACLASVFRILGGFLVALVIINLFSIDGLAKDIILLQAAMPSAVMAMILASKYERDASLVASVVLITTVISIITIPLIMYVL